MADGSNVAPRRYSYSEDDKETIRNRFKYRKPTDQQREELEQGAELVNELVEFMLCFGPSRDMSLALTALEDFRMKLNKAIVIGGN